MLRQLIRAIATVILIVTLQVLVDTFSIMTGKLVIACSTAVLSHLVVVDDTQPVPNSPCPHPPHQLPALGLRVQLVDLVTIVVIIIFTSYYCCQVVNLTMSTFYNNLTCEVDSVTKGGSFETH